MGKKIFLILAVVVLVLAATAAVLYKTGVLGGNVAQRLLASYLDNNENVASWAIGGATYKDGALTASDFKITTKQGVIFTFEKLNMTNLNVESRTADRLELFNSSLQRGESGKVCTAAYIEMDDFRIKNVNGINYPGFSSANADQLSCADAYSMTSAVNYTSKGVFDENGVYQHNFVLNQIAVISGENIIDIPSIAAESTYDRRTTTLKSTLQPVEVENLFNIDMDVTLADFLPEEIAARVASDPHYNMLQDVVIDFMRVKLVDRGVADSIISTLGIIFGESDLESGRRTLIRQISASNAFEETYENGRAIQQALIEFVRNPHSVEFIIDPDEPMNLVMGGDISTDFIIDYNISFSVNGGALVNLR